MRARNSKQQPLVFNESGDANRIAQWLEIGDEIEFMGWNMKVITISNNQSHFLNCRTEPICECGTRNRNQWAEDKEFGAQSAKFVDNGLRKKGYSIPRLGPAASR